MNIRHRPRDSYARHRLPTHRHAVAELHQKRDMLASRHDRACSRNRVPRVNNSVILARFRQVAAIVALVVGVMGCADDDATTTQIKGLQREQFSLIGQICQRPAELRNKRNRAIWGETRRELAVLLRTVREQPEARVRTFYTGDNSAFDEGGRGTEVLTIRELAQREAYSEQGLRVALEANFGAPRRCVVSVRSRILRALNG